MQVFWQDFIRPFLEALGPRHIVEIGSEKGDTTRLLLEWAQGNGARVTAVDPAPLFDWSEWRREFGPVLAFCQLPSLVALKLIKGYEVVLIDGDHNWYTVYHELKLIESRCAELGQAMPLMLLHDVWWPYGRRDLYYHPDTIPQEYRQSWAQRGILMTSPELVAKGGLNASHCNAEHEGGPRNGVLTAVEDFVKETRHPMELVVVPAAFGLGILLPGEMAARFPELARKVRMWAAPEIAHFLSLMEIPRLAALLRGSRSEVTGLGSSRR